MLTPDAFPASPRPGRAARSRVRARTLAVLAVVVALGAAGCASTTGTGSTAPTSSTPSSSAAKVTPTDYSDPAHWLAVPTTIDKPVDVFYLYPTSYTKANASQPVVGPIDDPGMMAGAAVALQRQATAFAPSANIFAPYYRQADTASRAAMPQSEQVEVVAGAPTVDGIAAFEYYIEHDNDGRPFILVGHSLGSNVMANLLEQYMPKHKDVYKRMVAAYVVGYSITPDYLAANPMLKFAEGADDTGVIVSWNTEATTVDGTNPVLLPGGLAINPITWTRTEEQATAAQTLGSISLDPKTGLPVMDADGQPTKVMGLADARVDTAKGVIICDSVNPADYAFGMPVGVYHPFDYPFYYFDVRANAAERVAKYLAK
ncbi:MAG: DUF3089 domain-containing protein [Actinobacteria bacterium]|nr:DUF3089 domain-containing protein [Actinomycetota bacterium]